MDYSRGGRENNIRRAQLLAHYLQSKGHTVVVSLVAPYRDIREELKAAADVTEVYVHTTETRGREEKHASDYEAPLTDFIDIDTTGKSVEESLQEVLDCCALSAHFSPPIEFPTIFVGLWTPNNLASDTSPKPPHGAWWARWTPFW